MMTFFIWIGLVVLVAWMWSVEKRVQVLKECVELLSDAVDALDEGKMDL